MRSYPRLLLLILFVALFTARLSAQDAKQPDEKKKTEAGKKAEQEPQPFVIPIVNTDVWANTNAWLRCTGAVAPGPAWNPLGPLGARMAMSHPEKGVPEWKFVFDEPLPLWHRYLELIRDGHKLPDVNRIDPRKELKGSDFGIYWAYVQAVDRSHEASLEMFKKAAAANEHVAYPELRTKPAQYRGEIITVTGHITRVRAIDAPRHATTPIRLVYFTEIQGPFKKEPPTAVIFTELPGEIKLNVPLDMDVTFYGYFLGHVKFEGDQKRGEKDVISPYLIGNTLVVNKMTLPPPEVSYSYELIVVAVGGIAAALFLAVLLNFWFRRADRRIQAQLDQVRDKHNPFSLEPETPPAPPIAEPVQPSPPPADKGAP